MHDHFRQVAPTSQTSVENVPAVPRVQVILLNWNGWSNTIECLESVLRLDYSDFQVIVCDNNSSDHSLDKIAAWAEGGLAAEHPNPALARLGLPPVPKPLPYTLLPRHKAESRSIGHPEPLLMIQNGENLGFAGGMNVGLRCAMRDPESRYFWLLNNDTVVEPDSLTALVRRMETNPSMGLSGSLTLSYDSPREVQTEGGNHYSRWTARVRKRPLRYADEIVAPPAQIDYVNGASMMASRAFLEQVGLLEESYYLYFEELDWAMRAKGRFSLGCAHDSVIYHKEGAAIGSNRDRMKRSLLSEKHMSRSRVLFTRRFFPWALPTVVAAISVAALERGLRGDWDRCGAMISSILEALMHPGRRIR